jgi:ankyrin repeat protein
MISSGWPPAAREAGSEPTPEALAAAAAKALADAATRGDAAALARLLPPLAPAPPQAALDEALLAAVGGRHCPYRLPSLEERDAAAAILLGAGAAANSGFDDWETPLHVAARRGNVPLIRRLLAAGARVDATADQGYSSPYYGRVPDHSDGMPHHHAASFGRCEALALLLDSGGEVRLLLEQC